MYIEEEFEEVFVQEISKLTLYFHNPSLELKYDDYKIYKRRVPMWFKWLMWTLVLIFLARRIQIVLFIWLYSDNALEHSAYVSEYIIISNLVVAIVGETLASTFKCLTFMKGFWMLVSWFFIVAYSSYIYYPTTVAMIPTGAPAYVFCVLICTWHIHTWFTSVVACTIGFIISTIYTQMGGLDLWDRCIVSLVLGWAFSGIALTSYITEYSDRYGFYKNMKITEEKEQWKDLLNRLPLGVVVIKKGDIDFYNDECEKLFSSNPQPLTLESFETIKEARSKQTLKALMANEKELEKAEGKQFVHEVDSTQKSYFSIRHSNITFRGQKSTAIILQDETSFEELKRLDEKYQRLYLASVVHDIRTPVNGILGILEAIEHYSANGEVKNLIRVAKNFAMLLLFLTYDIIDYSQIEAKTISVQSVSFTPKDVLRECMQLLEFNFRQKGLSLIQHILEGVPEYIFSDTNRFKQILLNLLGNALKFTFKGEVKITLSYSSEKDLLITEVKDTGIGIKEEDMPKLFKLFGKVQENTEVNPTGVGMGLTICKKLTELLGGTIKAESVFGVGSTFTFTVSCGLGRNAAPSPSALQLGVADERDVSISLQDDSHSSLAYLSPQSHQPLLKNRNLELSPAKVPFSCICPKLLIVDDSESNIFGLQNYCKILNVPNDAARSGIEAIKLVQTKTESKCCPGYRLVFMDINMPVMDGVTATRKIRELEKERKIPKVSVVALTAANYEKGDLKGRYGSFGFDDLLKKPISKTEFEQVLINYLPT